MRFYNKGKQQTVYGKTKEEIIQKYKKALKEEPKTKEPTLEQWYKMYLELYKIGNVRQTTIEKTNITFKKLKKFYKLKLSQINQFEVQKLINQQKSTKQKENVFVLLNALLEKARKNGLIQKNIMELVERKKYKAKEKIALSHKEQEQFEEVCKNDKFGNYYLICLYQGLRKGECLALNVQDIDFEKRTININKSMDRGVISETKNEQSNRTIPLFNKSFKILKEQTQGKRKNQLVFEIGINTVDRKIKELSKKAKIRPITTHILRHTFITRCQEANIPLFVVQSWVGHRKGSEITTKIYTHLNQETNEQYINILNQSNK